MQISSLYNRQILDKQKWRALINFIINYQSKSNYYFICVRKKESRGR